MAESTAPTVPDIKVNVVGLQAIVNWSWKLIPILWIVFRFYDDAHTVSTKTVENTAKITALETQVNSQDRLIVGLRAEIDSLHDYVVNNREFKDKTGTQTNADRK